jgi:site-specific DNA-methyltransferase (adenine-specific)
VIQGQNWVVHVGNNLDILPTLPDNSIDSIVTDPPYELGFMGKKWDSSGIAYSVELWKECLRVLKPGGHLLSFGGTRTWHRVAVAIEDAGFEVRDSIAWMYGSGFPKSLDVAKAIDKQAGYEGKVIGTESIDVGMQGGSMHAGRERRLEEREIKELSPEAKQWEGWGTALKPAFEPIVVARKPLIGTVAENVLTHGTGGLNIDGSRIGTEQLTYGGEEKERETSQSIGSFSGEREEKTVQGRWPANVILDEYSAELLDEQSGTSKSTPSKGHNRNGNQVGDERTSKAAGMYGDGAWIAGSQHNDSGGASRFFYVAKASKRDRNEGLEGLPETSAADMVDREEDSAEMNSPRAGAGRTSGAKNFHPTVKPTELMKYLIKLVTPPNGTVLDPFTGSGSTGKAALIEGFRFIGIEMTEDYVPIIEGRLKNAEQKIDEGLF